MKVKYPAEAFALGLILFSGGMKEAFLSGILVILSVVLAEFLKNMLENADHYYFSTNTNKTNFFDLVRNI